MGIRNTFMPLLHIIATFTWPTLGSQTSSNASLACPKNCHGIALGGATIYGWVSPLDGLPESGVIPNVPDIPRFSATATVVTQINTVMLTTEVITYMAPEWVPPETNADGTQIQRVTYGDGLTTTVAFPTPFFKWPNAYEWSGTFWDVEATACVTATTKSTSVLAKPGPQPTEALILGNVSNRNSSIPYMDPLGLFAYPHYLYAFDNWPFWDHHAAEALNFTGRSIQSCIPGWVGGPDWGGLGTTWAVSTATVYTS